MTETAMSKSIKRLLAEHVATTPDGFSVGLGIAVAGYFVGRGISEHARLLLKRAEANHGVFTAAFDKLLTEVGQRLGAGA